MTTTQTMTLPPRAESHPETFELSIKTPTKSLRELSRRVVGAAASSPPSPSSDEEENIRNEDAPPATAQPVVQRWNSPKGNTFRLGFAFFSFIITGLGDGAIGVGRCHL